MENDKYINFELDNIDNFYYQIEQWNQMNQFICCIQALQTVPQEHKNYRYAYAMARALENYAVLGDCHKNPTKQEMIQALQQALEVLKTVETEGSKRAEWNMRMAYGHLYLAQYHQAIVYAQRWQKQLPNDNTAKAIVQLCKKKAQNQNNNTSLMQQHHLTDNEFYSEYDLINL